MSFSLDARSDMDLYHNEKENYISSVGLRESHNLPEVICFIPNIKHGVTHSTVTINGFLNMVEEREITAEIIDKYVVHRFRTKLSILDIYWAKSDRVDKNGLPVLELLGVLDTQIYTWSPYNCWLNINIMLQDFPESSSARVSFCNRIKTMCQTRGCRNERKSSCATCKTIHYCSKECQLADWKDHKTHCQMYQQTELSRRYPYVNSVYWEIMETYKIDFQTFEDSMHGITNTIIRKVHIKHPSIFSYKDQFVTSLRVDGPIHINFAFNISGCVNDEAPKFIKAFGTMVNMLNKYEPSKLEELEIDVLEQLPNKNAHVKNTWVGLLRLSASELAGSNRLDYIIQHVICYPETPILYEVYFIGNDGVFPWHPESSLYNEMKELCQNYDKYNSGNIFNKCSLIGCKGQRHFVCDYCRKSPYCSLICRDLDRARHEKYCVLQMVLSNL